MSTSEDQAELHRLLVAEYPRYVARVLEARAIAVNDVLGDAIVEGATVLDGLLDSFDRTPALEQRTSPLELFREALRPVDHALSVLGVDPSPSGGRPASLAWDRYDLAPGSSQVLGPVVHEAHMRWAIGKAQAIAPMVNRPTVRLVTTDEGHDALISAIEQVGYTARDDGSVLIVNADLPEANRLIADARSGESSVRRIIVIGESPNDLRTTAMKALGAHVVVDTQRFLDSPSSYLPTIG